MSNELEMSGKKLIEATKAVEAARKEEKKAREALLLRREKLRAELEGIDECLRQGRLARTGSVYVGAPEGAAKLAREFVELQKGEFRSVDLRNAVGVHDAYTHLCLRRMQADGLVKKVGRGRWRRER